jgi:hypothetical protein
MGVRTGTREKRRKMVRKKERKEMMRFEGYKEKRGDWGAKREGMMRGMGLSRKGDEEWGERGDVRRQGKRSEEGGKARKGEQGEEKKGSRDRERTKKERRGAGTG